MENISTKHRALGRSVVQHARKPPVNVDSVPVVGQIVDSLLGNGAGSDAQPSSSPNTGNGGSGGNGSSGGNSGNGNGNSNGNGNGGSGSSGGDAGGSTPTPAASPTSGSGGTIAPPGPIAPSPNSPTPTPGNPSGSPSANNASSGGSMANNSGPGIGGTLQGVGSGQSAPVNVETVSSSTAISAPLGTSTSGALVAAIPSSSQYSLGSAGSKQVGTTSLSPTITTSTAIPSGNQLSGGAIAGITIVCSFFALALILVVVRRRSVARRVELRRQWWFGRHGSGGNSSRSSVASNGEAAGNRRSARSSFATNFDQGLMLSADPPPMFSRGVTPDLPPMAEVRERNSVLINTGAAVARRESMNSMLSNGNDPDAQYLTVPGHDNVQSSTPMCVRPFSPSESFAFPKPPVPPSPTADPLVFSGSRVPASPRFSATFVLSTPLYPQISTSSDNLSPSIASANPTNPSVNPFADPVKSGFADIIVVHRPFHPSLGDELAVRPGDRIRLLQIFSDGWAFIEKLASSTGPGERHERGLIPLDCLRDAGQALPISPTQEKVSNYGSDQLVPVAL